MVFALIANAVSLKLIRNSQVMLLIERMCLSVIFKVTEPLRGKKNHTTLILCVNIISDKWLHLRSFQSGLAQFTAELY